MRFYNDLSHQKVKGKYSTTNEIFIYIYKYNENKLLNNLFTYSERKKTKNNREDNCQKNKYIWVGTSTNSLKNEKKIEQKFIRFH